MTIQPREWYVPRQHDARAIPKSDMTVRDGVAGLAIERYWFDLAPETPGERAECPVRVEVEYGDIHEGRASRLLPSSLLHRHRLGPYAAHPPARAFDCPSCYAEGAPED